jgi:hypothetical protein
MREDRNEEESEQKEGGEAEEEKNGDPAATIVLSMDDGLGNQDDPRV